MPLLFAVAREMVCLAKRSLHKAVIQAATPVKLPLMSISISDLHWTFPLPRPHCGIALGNGIQGILVWGDECLCLTIARAGFWDHRGGNAFTTSATFPKVRALWKPMMKAASMNYLPDLLKTSARRSVHNKLAARGSNCTSPTASNPGAAF
jgi:hypothetical protein